MTTHAADVQAAHTDLAGPAARLWPLLLAVWVVVTGIVLVGLGARATYGAQTSADEPYYLMTADSLARDGDLDIADELAARAFEPYHEIDVDPQTTPLEDGRHLSPHDPLLPAVLAPAMAVGGWVAAKGFLAVLTGFTAAATAWVAIRHIHVRRRTAALVAVGLFASVPLSPYGTQVYPEMSAALLVVGAVAGAIAVRGGRVAGPTAVVVLCVVGLPWLSVKYAPVAAALAVIAAWRLWRGGYRRALGWAVLATAAAGVVYLVAHQVLYGGWTVYAAGDHFVDTGELSVVGLQPDYLGRTRRLVGLLADRQFGIGIWTPAWLALPAAVGWLVGRRQADRWVLLGPLLAGWLVATFVALTMHGWWVPGRQVVVVLPLAVIVLAAAVDQHRVLAALVAVGAIAGAVNWIWLAVETSTGVRTLIVDFTATAALPYRVLATIAHGSGSDPAADVGRALWALVLVATAWWGWRAGRSGAPPRVSERTPPRQVRRHTEDVAEVAAR